MQRLWHQLILLTLSKDCFLNYKLEIYIYLGMQQSYGCTDVWNDCERHTRMCHHFYINQYKCRKTCGICKEELKRVHKYRNVCSYDSPCGSGATKCVQTYTYPYFECKCQRNYRGKHCEIEDCPCLNGGRCLACSEKGCLCDCPVGWLGEYCSGKIDHNKQ